MITAARQRDRESTLPSGYYPSNAKSLPTLACLFLMLSSLCLGPVSYVP